MQDIQRVTITTQGGDLNEAKVNSKGSLQTTSDCSPRTVVTTRGSFDNVSVATLASAAERCSLIIQAHGADLLVNLEGANPDSGDYVIAAGLSLTVPFPFGTAVKGQGVSGTGTFVTIEARHAS